MAELKTRKTAASVDRFLASVKDDKRREDARKITKIMTDLTGETPQMWGDSIIGFGSYHYRYASGREGDWMMTGLSPRKQALTIYIMPGFDAYGHLLAHLGTYSLGKSCLYIKRLEEVEMEVLKELIDRAYHDMRLKYAASASDN